MAGHSNKKMTNYYEEENRKFKPRGAIQYANLGYSLSATKAIVDAGSFTDDQVYDSLVGSFLIRDFVQVPETPEPLSTPTQGGVLVIGLGLILASWYRRSERRHSSPMVLA